MTTITIGIRKAELDDAEAIADVHHAAWQGAYAGIIPHRSLTNMLQWLQAVRSTTIRGGPSALAPQPVDSSATTTNAKVSFDMTPASPLTYFSTISQPCISRCNAEQNSVQ